MSTLYQNIEDKLQTDFWMIWILEWFGSGMPRGNTFMVKKGAYLELDYRALILTYFKLNFFVVALTALYCN